MFNVDIKCPDQSMTYLNIIEQTSVMLLAWIMTVDIENMSALTLSWAEFLINQQMLSKTCNAASLGMKVIWSTLNISLLNSLVWHFGRKLPKANWFPCGKYGDGTTEELNLELFCILCFYFRQLSVREAASCLIPNLSCAASFLSEVSKTRLISVLATWRLNRDH